jgi:hypothetical protein
LIEVQGRFAKPLAKEPGSETKVGCVEIEILGYTREIMGRRPRLTIDISVELLPVDIDCTAQMRNGTLRCAGNFEVLGQVRHP